MITIKSDKEIKLLQAAGRRLALVLSELKKLCYPGISAAELDRRAGYLMKKYHSRPSFFKYRPAPHLKPYPANICVSVNETIVHGIPKEKIVFKEGDLVTVDAGLIYAEMYVDSAFTVGIGKIPAKTKKLIKATEKALEAGIKQCLVGKTIGDIGFAIETTIKKSGFSVVKDLVGHGVGYAVHEEPAVPNFGKKNQGVKLEPGMILALEPMACFGSGEILELEDGSFITLDNSLSAQSEHTVVITQDKPLVVTELKSIK
ncbi:MAG: type I methionyl aminopeptidase [Patescibacteria group bacterium]